MPFVGPLTLIGSALRNLREAAPEASRRACINIPGAKGTIRANCGLSYEHSHRRRLLGSGRSLVFPPREGIPRCHLRWTAPARCRLLKCGALLSFIGGAFATGGGGKAGSKPVAIIATIDRGSLIAAGATEQTRNRGAHGRPNAVVRSARERRKEMLGAGDTSTQQ
jgi:hypothetical protein